MEVRTEKPLTVRRHECIRRICAAINDARLPAFAVVDILEKIISETRPLAEEELRRDMAAMQAAEAHDDRADESRAE